MKGPGLVICRKERVRFFFIRKHDSFLSTLETDIPQDFERKKDHNKVYTLIWEFECTHFYVIGECGWQNYYSGKEKKINNNTWIPGLSSLQMLTFDPMRNDECLLFF